MDTTSQASTDNSHCAVGGGPVLAEAAGHPGPRWRAGLSTIAVAIVLAVVVLPVPRAHAGELPAAIEPHFRVDPILDTVLTGAAAGATMLTEIILSTGEIVPQPVTPGSADKIWSFDRLAITQTIDPHAGLYSNVGLGVALGFAVLDPILSGVREGPRATLVDGIMYAESLSLTAFLTDLTKIAVRRPRPIDYRDPSVSNTDRVLSFFSGHASSTAAAAATASYLAFVRWPHTARPWITLVAGTLLTAFVSYQRVRAGAHFPTDVIAGSMAGGSIGVIVPHIHRVHPGGPDFWFALAPTEGGGKMTFGRRF